MPLLGKKDLPGSIIFVDLKLVRRGQFYDLAEFAAGSAAGKTGIFEAPIRISIPVEWEAPPKSRGRGSGKIGRKTAAILSREGKESEGVTFVRRAVFRATENTLSFSSAPVKIYFWNEYGKVNNPYAAMLKKIFPDANVANLRDETENILRVKGSELVNYGLQYAASWAGMVSDAFSLPVEYTRFAVIAMAVVASHDLVSIVPRTHALRTTIRKDFLESVIACSRDKLAEAFRAGTVAAI